MTKIYFIALILSATSCFKDKNCKHLTKGNYTVTFFQNNGYNLTENTIVDYKKKGELKINNSTFYKSNCSIEGYYNIGYQSSIKIKGEIKKINNKKYLIEGNYLRKYIYNGEYFEYSDKFLISNN